ncbi:MAG: hypothetical protein OEV89_08905 [Desulfobulbaceae bacterium]|nr:hypothetical protein [Desulfobulbaceae bacterium]HIJ90810.1 hypothetical protein [Deltaproteobacteria bacterium]
MKRDFFNRYERDSNGSILIDVAAEKVEDLYSDFDRSAPYIRRDLDQDLVDYLINCARELEKEPFTISFTLARTPDEARLTRIRRSINNFFLYLVEVERQKIRQMVRKSLVLFCIGVTILFVAVWVNRWLGSERTVVANVFAEGLTVAAWVSLWEALAIFLIEWFPRLRNINLYRRLATVHPVFRSVSETMPNGEKASNFSANPGSPDHTVPAS